ncbi:hypothetical protein [Actinokineospora fastidiosa]|uniref:Uncharacterized protein n=1 Tax=Actinokineospora fastidiosa TaxID=1816 RepID=A0A918GP56_9PSEU|nr:hypothetical protein [Actinokineospora fastidiosa]GGS46482.1 hypothetical protein GCM10010171_47110 [Actinokineospora fastidiosa]
MPEKFGSHEKAAMFLLLRENRAVPNTELTRIGIDLRPAGRDRLNRAGLLKTTKDTRPYIHQITDDGIAWCEQEMTAVEPPVRSGPLVVLGFEMLRCVAAHLRRGGVSLAEVISPRDLETLIRTAYLELSVKPQDWVRLAKLRPKLGAAEKGDVDEVLLRMYRAREANLVPDSNRKVLTDADHAAAIRIGGEDKHLMAIEES